MVSKIRSLTFMLLLAILFSGVAHSEDQVLGVNGKLVTDGQTSDSIYYGKTFGVDTRNLFVGGILQDSPNPDKNDLKNGNRYEQFADSNHAIYVPTYYSLSYLITGNPVVDTVNALSNTGTAVIDDSAEVDLAATGHPTAMNGLKSPALQNQQYNTIIGYSGGTATAVTALLSQKVRCDTLILISPMKGTLSDTDYENEIKAILTSGAVNHITVIWSPEDTPTGSIGFYEAQISSDWDSMGRIAVYSVDLPQDKNNGMQAHKDIFFDYAMTHITNGEYVVPAAVAGASNTGTQPQEPVAPAVQGPGNSVVGEWIGTYYVPTEKLIPGSSGHGWPLSVTINIYANGTWDLGNLTGKWIQTGDTVYLQPKNYTQQTLVMKIKSDNGIMKMGWINNTPDESWDLTLVHPWEPASNAGTQPRSLVNVGTGTVLHKLANPYYGCTYVTFSPDGSKLATLWDDTTARIWDVATGAELHELKNVGMIRFSPDGSKVATEEADGFQCGIWDVEAWKKLHKLDPGGPLLSIAFSPDGTKIATGSDNHTACIWDVATGARLQELKHVDRSLLVTFSPDGSKLATGDAWDENSVRIWDATTGIELRELKYSSRVDSVAFSPDGSKLAALGGGEAYIWDVATGAKLHELLDLGSSPYYSSEVTFSPDSSKLATLCHDNSIYIWNVATGRVLQELVQNGSVTSIAFSPDSTKLATGSLNYTAYIWDVATGTKLQELEHDGPVLSVSFSPDGSKLATGCKNETALIWDVTTQASVPFSEPMSSTKSTTKTNTASGFDAMLSIAALLSIFVLWKGR